jgi:Transposase DDE domain
MASVGASLERVKSDPLGILTEELVESACRRHEHEWRDRRLGPATTVGLFAQQVLAGNCPCSEVRHIGGSSFTPQAYCAARSRLPRAVLETLFFEVYRRVAGQTGEPDHLWHGHRTFHVDGSSFSMPDTEELRKAFGMPSGQAEGCGFPVAHLLVLFSAATGLLVNMWAQPLVTSDLADTPSAHQHLEAGDILIGDDSFGGYPHLAALVKQGIHGLFPVHHLRIIDFTKNRKHRREGAKGNPGLPTSRWIKSLGKKDQLVEYFKPKRKPPRMTQKDYDALPESVVVRELRRTVVRPGLGKITITLVTTLLDPVKYPPDDLLELRLRRWDVETDIRHLKATMKMDVLRCMTEEGVRKELAVFGLVYNLVREVMLIAAKRQDVPVSRISFADAYKWLRHARPGDPLPPLIVNRHRPDRIEPRCRKRRPKKFVLMNKSREVLRKELKNKRKTA